MTVNTIVTAIVLARAWTVEPSMSTLPIHQLEFANTSPAAMKTNGPVRFRGEPVRQERPPEDHDRQVDEGGLVHLRRHHLGLWVTIISVLTSWPPSASRAQIE